MHGILSYRKDIPIYCMNKSIYNIVDFQSDLTKLESALVSLRFPTGQAKLDALQKFLNTLRDDLVVGVETEYVDAMYRDEYYHFYSTKMHDYSRNCVKMSFFKAGNLVAGNPVDYDKADAIAADFLGFLVVRPIPACIGRNVIDPCAKKAGLDDIDICRSHVRTTALGIKVSVEGFPHSSQDGEMMKCAETSLWSMVEYYGHKYPAYKPVLASDILEAMRPVSQQRQLPSTGLTFEQISVGLKTFDFCPKIYKLWKPDPTDSTMVAFDYDMKEIFACYVESGFPLALCLLGPGIGHAAVCVGKQKFDRSSALEKETLNGKDFLIWNRSLSAFVVNDDNVACYQKADIVWPTTYYNAYHGVATWDKVRIDSFMVPLPSKVYRDAYNAIKCSKSIVKQVAADGTVVRTFLASSRSFRNHIANSKTMDSISKNIMLNVELPRFVWVTELASKADFENEIVTGLVLLDATDLAEDYRTAALLIYNDGYRFVYDASSRGFKSLSLPSPLKLESYRKNIN